MQTRMRAELAQRRFNRSFDRWSILILSSVVAGLMLGHIIAYFIIL